ncbi:YopX family protein [Listeria monocytogenes]
MREIEFRGKRIDNGEWVYGNLMQFEDSATFIFVDERKGASTLTYAHFIINNMHAIDEKTIGQYTGLKDKNGKKIFEGDIVDISVYDRLDWSSIKGKVVFLNGAWLVEDVGHFAITLQSETNEIEIIGNVHENLGLREA